MRLVSFELKKLFDKGTLVYILAVVVFANLFLLWTNSDLTNEIAGASSYRAITQDIEGKTLDEKKQFLDEKVELFFALRNIEWYLVNGGATHSNPDFQEMYNEYGDIYNLKQYSLYTESLTTEYLFLTSIQSELNTVYDHEGFLQSTRAQADMFSQISIFKPKEDEPETFETLNTEKTAAAYEQLLQSNIEIDFYPQKGVLTAIDFFYTDVFILMFMLLISGQIINSERESGMLYYIRSTPKGRLKTAISKVFALWISLFVVLVGLYGTNLLYCHLSFGLGDLSRSIQSLPFLFRSTMPISVVEYLFIFIFAKWFVTAVLGIFIMLVILLFKKLVYGFGASIAILGLQLLTRVLINPLSEFNVIKHANFISFLMVNEWLGSYRNLYFLGKPVEMLNVVLISSGVFLVLSVLTFVIYFSVAFISPAKASAKKRSQKLKHTSVLKEEVFKIVLSSGAVLLVVAFFGYQLYVGITSESYITPDEIYKRHYIEPLAGKYTEDKYLWLVEQSKEFDESYEMDRKSVNGEISEDQYFMYKSQNFALYSRRDAFEQIIHSDIPYILENKGAQFVNETGYMILYDLYDNRTTLTATIISALLISVCLAGVFSTEKQSGMERILKTTPLGKFKVKKSKLVISFIIVLIVTVSTFLPQYIQVIRDYGLPAFFAPIKSMRMFADVPNFMTFFSLSVMSFLYRLVGGMLVATTTLFLSSRTKRFLTVVSLSIICFAIPPLLTLYGVDNMRYLGVYPLFHFAKFLYEPFGVLFLVFSFACALFFIIFFVMLLFEFEKDDFTKEVT